MKAIFERIDALAAAYTDVWEDVCNIESPSNDKEAVDRVSRYLMDLAADHGWKIQVLPMEQYGDVVCITMNPDAPGSPIALSGHIDTVHPIGSFGNPPCRREGNRLHGPGAMDCKGGVVAGLLAMHALEDCGFRARPVMMLLQSNEEVGSGRDKKSINWICDQAKNAAAFLNLEGYESSYAGKTTLIRKGIAGVLFKITGIEAHASYCAREGASAIAEAAHKILEIEKKKEDGGVTCNCGIISGGTVSNTVPGYCQFKVDVRYNTQEEYREVMAFLQEVADRVYIPGCSCEMELVNWRPAMELCDRNRALLSRVNELLEAAGMRKLELGKRTGGSDAADVTLYGIPCLDSIGAGGERAHSPEEYGYIDSLPLSAKRIVAIVCGL